MSEVGALACKTLLMIIIVVGLFVPLFMEGGISGDKQKMPAVPHSDGTASQTATTSSTMEPQILPNVLTTLPPGAAVDAVFGFGDDSEGNPVDNRTQVQENLESGSDKEDMDTVDVNSEEPKSGGNSFRGTESPAIHNGSATTDLDDLVSATVVPLSDTSKNKNSTTSEVSDVESEVMLTTKIAVAGVETSFSNSSVTRLPTGLEVQSSSQLPSKTTTIIPVNTKDEAPATGLTTDPTVVVSLATDVVVEDETMDISTSVPPKADTTSPVSASTIGGPENTTNITDATTTTAATRTPSTTPSVAKTTSSSTSTSTTTTISTSTSTSTPASTSTSTSATATATATKPHSTTSNETLLLDPIDTNPLSFELGQLSVLENGLRLSKGLKSTLLATTGSRLTLADGTRSEVPFHRQPDGAATFEFPPAGGGNGGVDGHGWVYVSNALSTRFGGVGAIRFNNEGVPTNYEMILNGTTSRNSKGGSTPWNTWISCEDIDDLGQCWEVDPFGVEGGRKTVLGGAQGGNFKGVAYDARNSVQPVFFLTHDSKNGELRRFTPSYELVTATSRTMNGTTGDTWDILSQPGTMEYLVLEPKSKTEKNQGTFTRTPNLLEGKDAAEKYFRKSHGIKIVENRLYFVSSTSKAMFILDLDNGTYKRTATLSRRFTGSPETIQMTNQTLYFADGPDSKSNNTSAVSVLHSKGGVLTVLESVDWNGDAKGLAFSPDKTRLYVAFQEDGKLFEIRRHDGLAFDGEIFQVKYSS